jgi:hypothetical protein
MHVSSFWFRRHLQDCRFQKETYPRRIEREIVMLPGHMRMSAKKDLPKTEGLQEVEKASVRSGKS